MKRKTLLAMAVALLCSVGSWAQASPTAGVAVAAGDYYIYNLGADMYLSKGSSYGTHATVDGAGTKITLAGSTDAYSIHFDGIDADKFLSNSAWTDFTTTQDGYTTWMFESVSVPNYANVYKIKANTGGNYLQWNGGNGQYGDEAVVNAFPGAASNGYWILIPQADRKDISRASKYNPVDVTYLITNPDMSATSGNKETACDGWTNELYRQWEAHDYYTGNYLERWAGTWGSSRGTQVEGGNWHLNNSATAQTLSGLPAGAYRLNAAATAVQQGTAEEITGTLLYAGDNTTSVSTAGIYSVRFTSDGSNDVTIGLKTVSTTANWISCDKFRLYYYGNDCSSSITNPNFDSNADGWTNAGTWGNNEVEFYNTTGGFDMYQDLTGLAAGIYAVEVQGFYRNGAGIDSKRAKAQESLIALLYAKGEDDIERNTALLSIYDEAGKRSAEGSLFGDIPNWMNQAQDFISDGYYSDNKVIVAVGAAGTLRIGAKKSGGVAADWTILDNFSLTKLTYATIDEAYLAEWTECKAKAQALLNSSDYSNILAGSTQRTALADAVALTPSDMEGYTAALVSLRSAVNNFKAAKYAYDQYATFVAPVISAENTTYGHIAGTEKATFDTNVTNAVGSLENTAESYYNLIAYTNNFISAKNPYDEYYYENETATRLGADASGVSVPTTAAEATAASHEINVINYNKFVAAEFADVSGTVLGGWTDDNVGSMTGQHWSGDGDEPYFEQKNGWWNATVWTMSRQQTVHLAAGSYVLRVAARVASGADAQLSVTVGAGDPIVTYAGHHGDVGLGITTSGEACYVSHDVDDTKEYTNGNNGRGFEWRYIPFVLDSENDVTLKFYAVNTSGQQWKFVSFCNLGIWCDPKVAARTELLTAISNASSARKSANEGVGVFQIPSAAGTTLASAITTAQSVYDDEDAVLSTIQDATTTMNSATTTYEGTTLNAPSSSTRYKLTLADRGTLSVDQSSKADEGVYGLPFATAADYMAQTFFLTQTTGNNYTLSFVDFDGTTRYVCTGENAKEGLGNARIRTTTDAEKALVIAISATPTANVFNMLNTADSNNKIGSNGGGMYTANDYTSWSIAEASQASVPVTISSGKYGTRIFPFTPSAIDGITYYSCATVAGTDLTLVKEDTPAANTPYILLASKDVDETLEGWGTATTTNYTTGLLTGIYTKQDIAADAHNYVLQTKGDGNQAFCLVTTTFTNSQPYRAYLTYEASAEVKVLNFVFDELPTSVKGIETSQNENAEIYNLAGQRLNKAQKGVNIINGKKVLVK